MLGETVVNILKDLGSSGLPILGVVLLAVWIGKLVRDVLTQVLQNPVLAYVSVFSILALLLLVSLILLRRINVNAFREQAATTSVIERAALAGDV